MKAFQSIVTVYTVANPRYSMARGNRRFKAVKSSCGRYYDVVSKRYGLTIDARDVEVAA